MKGPVVAGVLANNVWSLGGTTGRGGTSYNMFLAQPFMNYNFGEGWYVGTSPHHHGKLAHGRQQCVDAAGRREFGRVMKIGGKLPVNFPSAPITMRCGRSLARLGSCGRR